MSANPTPDQIRSLLREVKTIAVVGLSPRAERPSYRVSRAMQGFGYRIVPVRPAVTEVLGYLRQRRATGLDHPARGMIGIHRMDTEVDEMLGRRAFAATDATGEAENPGCCNRSGHLKPTDCK